MLPFVTDIEGKTIKAWASVAPADYEDPDYFILVFTDNTYTCIRRGDFESLSFFNMDVRGALTDLGITTHQEIGEALAAEAKRKKQAEEDYQRRMQAARETSERETYERLRKKFEVTTTPYLGETDDR